MSTSLLWIRNDLRIDDNPALDLALEQGCHQAVFFVTPHQWQQHDVADIKQDFILRHAKLLQFQLKQVGVQLQIIEVENYAEQVVLLQRYCEKHQIKQIFANKELELNEIERDRELISSGINLTLTQADTILPLGAVLNKQGLMFKVFTPYKKAWLKQFSITPFHIKPAMTTLPAYVEDHNVGRSANWPLSDHYLVNFFPQFLQHKIANYDEERDFPALPATSRVSPYLAIGAISVKRLVHQLMINQSQPNFSIEFGLESIGEQTWLSELIWREFYRNLLFHYPNLIKGKSFVEKYDNLLWPDHHELFLKWCDGKTGFPIIDAAMRQLKQIGWMHNRLRMVVASFLTKNLLVNW